MFYFPNYFNENIVSEDDEKIIIMIGESVDRLGLILSEITEYYKKHQFFYNQYKHGLSIALRPYGNDNPDIVIKDKSGEHDNSPIVALDSLKFKNASNNQYGNTGYLMMPCFSENIRVNLKELQQEDNLLRYVMSPKDTNIKTIADIAKKTKRCINILINNILQVVDENNPLKLRLPDKDDSKVIEFRIDVKNDK